jgi:alpha-L-arabinofuranosidase
MKSLKTAILTFPCVLALAVATRAAEFHVATGGKDTNPGTQAAPFRTIQHAAELAQPGDVVTVHAGIYREQVTPPRGGKSDAQRIVYQAAAGEKVTITGSEPMKGWEKAGNDTWKVTLPNRFFGKFNPYSDLIHGDWFGPNGRQHHTGSVYLNGHWLIEAARFDEVLKPAGNRPLWYAKVDGASTAEYLVNIAWLKVGGKEIPAVSTSAKKGTQAAACSEGGQCVGFIRAGDWLLYKDVDFGKGTDTVELRVASQAEASRIEVRLDKEDGELLGTADAAVTGDWQKWTTLGVTIKNTGSKKNLCLVIRPPRAATDKATIWAQFPGVNPNEADVEINARKTVFTPEKTGINYITLRGFTLRNAATNWAPPSAGQIGLVSAYWCKGWIIENNDIAYSKCSGVALGKYSDEFDNTNAAGSADPYTDCVRRALKNGWNKATVGSHIVRNNHIHHCEQTGVVGSMGCSFSSVTGNDIHDIHVLALFGGAEMAGIKFHGAIDVLISGNHIYRCGDAAGLWLDWMAQGAQVTRNLMHDNRGGCGDIFFEMQHGPILVANNLLLTRHRSFAMNSQGIAFAHNLIAGPIGNHRSDTRVTPYHLPHATLFAGLYPAGQGDSGDDRFYNNLIVAPCSLRAIDNSALPCFAAGNVFTGGAQASKFDKDPLLEPDFKAALKLSQKADGWYLDIALDKTWGTKQTRDLVTTKVLGKAKVANAPYDNADGSWMRINTDYFGKKRSEDNPFPGPFELPGGGKRTLKVWSR